MKSANAKASPRRQRGSVVRRSGNPVKFRAAIATLRKRARAHLRPRRPGVVALLRRARDEL